MDAKTSETTGTFSLMNAVIVSLMSVTIVILAIALVFCVHFTLEGPSKPDSLQKELSSISPGTTLLMAQNTPLPGVTLYKTDKGILLGNLKAGILVKGTLVDAITGRDLIRDNAHQLPFYKSEGEALAATSAREISPSSVDLNDGIPRVSGQEMDVSALQGALSQRLEALKSEARPAPVVTAAVPSSVAPTSAPPATRPSAETALVPAGAIPRVGFDNNGRPVSAAQKKEQTRALMGNLPEEWMMVYPAENEQHTITVMTDPTCPYCKALHDSISDINAAGITVRYLFYPRQISAGANTSRARELVGRINAAWCSSDPKAAMNMLFDGGSPGRPCAELPEDDLRPRDPAEDHYVIGEVLGVDGTPYIASSTGDMWAGFSGTADLIQRVQMSTAE